MKLTISIIALALMFLYIAETSIKFNPFKITFGNLSSAIAYILFLMSFILMTYSIHGKAFKSGYEKGFESGKDITIEALKEIAAENKNKSK